MSDPLSSFANDNEKKEDLNEYVEDTGDNRDAANIESVSTSQSAKDESSLQSRSETNSGGEDEASSDSTFQADEGGSADQKQNSAVENIKLDEESDAINSPRPASSDADMSELDLLAQIEEEMSSGPKDLDVVVENPEKIVKTMESYVAFTVKTKTTRSDFEGAEYCVKRRYNDFLWLRQQLEDQYPHLIIPPLPEKHSLTIDRFDKEFIRFREVALHRFTSRISQHPVTSRDENVKAFITLNHTDFQSFKKKGSGLLSRMTKSISTMGGSFMLKNRSDEHTKIYDYSTGLGERMGASDRITSRLIGEQNDYLTSTGSSIALYQNWQAAERRNLAENLGSFSELLESCHSAYKTMVDEGTLKVLLPFKEYTLYSEVIKSSLSKRDALQHELEILAEELVKANDELQQLESGQAGGGFLGRNSTEEAVLLRKDKVKTKITELESAHMQCKERLEERNKQLSLEIERWHLSKKVDMKEAIGGLADRNIQVYDQQIHALEETLHKLKECLVSN